MLDPDVRIKRATEDRKIDENDKIRAIIRVEFFVGDHGPFLERFDKDTYTADARDIRLNTFAREVRTS